MGCMEWIDLALVNAVMDHRFHKMRGISLLTEDMLASQEGLCSMELVNNHSMRFCGQLLY